MTIDGNRYQIINIIDRSIDIDISIIEIYISKLPVLLPLKSNSTSLCNKRIQNLLMRDLRGNCILFLKKPKTTSYVLDFFSYISAKLNALPDFVRTTESTGFKLENPRPHFVLRLFF